MKNKNVLNRVLMLLCVTILAVASVSAADVLFEDDFESGTSKWTADRWEANGGGTDYGTSSTLSCNYDSGCGNDYLWLEDDRALYTEVDTTNYEDVVFSYYRRTYSAYSTDRLEVSWKEGDYCNPWNVCGNNWDQGETYGCSACEWNKLEELRTSSWGFQSWNLPEGAEDSKIQIAFWLDNGENDIGLVDSVEVTGETDEEAPVTNPETDPTYPTDEDDVEICATVTDESAITGVWVNIDNGQDSNSYSMDLVEGDKYCKTVSALTLDAEDGMVVTYSITAEDEHGNSGTSEEEDFTFDGLPPTADAGGPYPCNEATVINLDGSASSDTVDLNLDYAWDLDGDGEFDDSYIVNPSYLCVDGLSVEDVSLKVTDNVGNEGTDSSTVTVSNLNPTANAGGPYTCNEGETITLDASSSSDPAGAHDLLAYAWDFDGATGANPEFTCGNGGDQIPISVEVSDGDGGVDIDNTVVVVIHNVAPVVEAGEDVTADEGELITINPTFTDFLEDTHKATVSWGDGSGDSTIDPASSPLSVSHTYVDEGVYTVTITVEDTGVFGGAAGSDTLTATVDNVNPQITSTGVAADSSYEGVQDEKICFSAEATDQGVEDVLTTLWDFGEGFSEVDCHTWEDDFEGTVTLRVEDGDGGFDEEEVSVKVYNYGISLDVGMNLISIPLVPEDKSVEAVLNGIHHEAVWAYQYDEEAGENVWLFHPGEDAPEGLGDLTEMVPGYGYYIEMEEEDILFNNGEKFYQLGSGVTLPPHVTLTTGWNLIGHYGLNTVDKRDEVGDLSGGSLADLADVTLLNEDAIPVNSLEPGVGYWAFVTGQGNPTYANSIADYDPNYHQQST